MIGKCAEHIRKNVKISEPITSPYISLSSPLIPLQHTTFARLNRLPKWTSLPNLRDQLSQPAGLRRIDEPPLYQHLRRIFYIANQYSLRHSRYLVHESPTTVHRLPLPPAYTVHHRHLWLHASKPLASHRSSVSAAPPSSPTSSHDLIRPSELQRTRVPESSPPPYGSDSTFSSSLYSFRCVNSRTKINENLYLVLLPSVVEPPKSRLLHTPSPPLPKLCVYRTSVIIPRC